MARLTARNWEASLREASQYFRARKQSNANWGLIPRSAPRIGYQKAEIRTPEAIGADVDWDTIAVPISVAPFQVERKFWPIIGVEQRPHLPLSYHVREYSDLLDWIEGMEHFNRHLEQVKRLQGDDNGWLDAQMGDLQAFVPQSGRWKNWWVVAGDFVNKASYPFPREELDLLLAEMARYWPKDGEVYVPIRKGKLRGWPVWGKGKDDLLISLLMAQERWMRFERGDGPYLSLWEEEKAVIRRIADIGEIEEPCFLILTRTGPNKKFRPTYLITTGWPRLLHEERGFSPRTRHVEGASYPENVDDVLQGYAERYAKARSPVLHDVFHHQNGPELARRVARYRRTIAAHEGCREWQIHVTGLDVSQMDKSWTETDQDEILAGEARHFPVGMYYRGREWRTYRLRGKILGPPIRTGDAGVLYNHVGYNPSGIGTTGDDNDKVLFSKICRAVGRLRNWTPRETFERLGRYWMVFIKGDDTLLMIKDIDFDVLAAVLYSMGLTVTREGAVFLAVNAFTGRNRLSGAFVKEASPEWFRPTKDIRLTPIGDHARDTLYQGDPNYDMMWRIKSSLPNAWASPEDLATAARQAAHSLAADIASGALAGDAYGDIVDYFENAARGDAVLATQLAEALGLPRDMITKQYTRADPDRRRTASEIRGEWVSRLETLTVARTRGDDSVARRRSKNG